MMSHEFLICVCQLVDGLMRKPPEHSVCIHMQPYKYLKTKKNPITFLLKGLWFCIVLKKGLHYAPLSPFFIHILLHTKTRKESGILLYYSKRMKMYFSRCKYREFVIIASENLFFLKMPLHVINKHYFTFFTSVVWMSLRVKLDRKILKQNGVIFNAIDL